MIVVTLKGGLGNQMFQYAAAKALALKHSTEVRIDKSFLNADPQGRWTKREYKLDVFPGLRDLKEYSMIDKITGKFSSRERFTEVGLTYNRDFEKCGIDVLLDGYFQTEKYFDHYANIIRSEFSFPDLRSEVNKSEVKEITEAPVAIGVHVRRGDMVSLKSASDFHGTASIEYYQSAFRKMLEIFGKEIHFFVFSDDQEWTKKNIIPPAGSSYMTSSPDNGITDMHLLSLCDHHIIANSSFSWWGSWLSNNVDKTVIAPKMWFKDAGQDTSDLVPESWIRL